MELVTDFLLSMSSDRCDGLAVLGAMHACGPDVFTRRRTQCRDGTASVDCRLLTLTIAGTALAAGSPVTNVTVGKAQKLIKERAGKADFVILDVRTPDRIR